jgi:dTDP-4-amino-4,6-dideoxygalactose transaminase
VITTPYTFVASSSCILNAGATPVFVDIEPESYNIDASLVERAITPRTKAILPVHFGGNIADVVRLREIADKHGLKIIEDAAQAHGAMLKGGRGAGSFGDMAIFSLQHSKLLTSGEGGVVTTNSDELADLAWSLRHYGRTRTGPWWEHVRLGWHYRMTEMQGALLIPQLKKLPEQNARRQRNAKVLFEGLSRIPGIAPHRIHPETESAAHYIVILRYDSRAWDGLPREKMLKAVQAEGVPCATGYTWPLYENPLFLDRGFGHYRGKCPVAEKACREESVWMSHNLLLGSEEDARDIAKRVCEGLREPARGAVGRVTPRINIRTTTSIPRRAHRSSRSCGSARSSGAGWRSPAA